MATTGDAALDRVLRALSALGRERASELVDEAWARAEAEVVETLTEAMRVVLLRAAATELEQGGPLPERGEERPRQAPARPPGQDARSAPRTDAGPAEAVEPAEDGVAAELGDHPDDDETAGVAEAADEDVAAEVAEAEKDVVEELATVGAAPGTATAGATGGGEAWYVYAVVPAVAAEELAQGSGVDPGRRLAAVVVDDLAAIAGPVALDEFAPEALRARLADRGWVAERVLAHEAVLRRCVDAGAVVPMRFATVVTDEDAVRSFLRDSAPVLRSTLEGLTGRQEWGVKAYVDWQRLRDELTAEAAREDQAEGAGAAYFTRKRQQRESRVRAQDVARRLARACHDDLSAIADRATLLALREPEPGEPEGESMVLNGAFLVGVDVLDDFSDAVERLADEHVAAGVRIEVTGPWPPYSFVDLAAREAVG